MLRVDGLLLLVVAHLVGLRAQKVDELRAARQHQLAGVVRHADVGTELLHHLVHRSARYGNVIFTPAAAGCTPRTSSPSAAATAGCGRVHLKLKCVSEARKSTL